MDQPKPKRIDRRRNRTCVRFSKKETRQMKKLMKETGLSAQKIMKDALFSRTDDLTKPKYSTEQAEIILSDLRAIGESTAAFAKAFNEGRIAGAWSKKLNPIFVALLRVRMKIFGIIPHESVLAPLPTFAT